MNTERGKYKGSVGKKVLAVTCAFVLGTTSLGQVPMVKDNRLAAGFGLVDNVYAANELGLSDEAVRLIMDDYTINGIPAGTPIASAVSQMKFIDTSKSKYDIDTGMFIRVLKLCPNVEKIDISGTTKIKNLGAKENMPQNFKKIVAHSSGLETLNGLEGLIIDFDLSMSKNFDADTDLLHRWRKNCYIGNNSQGALVNPDFQGTKYGEKLKNTKIAFKNTIDETVVREFLIYMNLLQDKTAPINYYDTSYYDTICLSYSDTFQSLNEDQQLEVVGRLLNTENGSVIINAAGTKITFEKLKSVGLISQNSFNIIGLAIEQIPPEYRYAYGRANELMGLPIKTSKVGSLNSIRQIDEIEIQNRIKEQEMKQYINKGTNFIEKVIIASAIGKERVNRDIKELNESDYSQEYKEKAIKVVQDNANNTQLASIRMVCENAQLIDGNKIYFTSDDGRECNVELTNTSNCFDISGISIDGEKTDDLRKALGKSKIPIIQFQMSELTESEIRSKRNNEENPKGVKRDADAYRESYIKQKLEYAEGLPRFLLEENARQTQASNNVPDTKPITQPYNDNADSSKPVFKDVQAGSQLEKDAQFLTEKGILKGDGNGNINPNAPVTRAQMAAFVLRLAGKEHLLNQDMPNPFADVTRDAWYCKVAAVAKQEGIMNGVSDTQFNPNGNVTGTQAALTLARTFMSAEDMKKIYPNTDWQEMAEKAAKDLGIAEKAEKISKDPIDRATVVKYIANAARKMEGKN